MITRKIILNKDRSGLVGPGRIIQQTADEPVIEIENASSVEVHGLTLTRAEGTMDTSSEGLRADRCPDLVVENVQVIDNRTRAAAIALRACPGARISRCLVRNYMRLTVEDRTADLNWGYAFNCTDGSGILVGDS